jgi:hypothetical protein
MPSAYTAIGSELIVTFPGYSIRLKRDRLGMRALQNPDMSLQNLK